MATLRVWLTFDAVLHGERIDVGALRARLGRESMEPGSFKRGERPSFQATVTEADAGTVLGHVSVRLHYAASAEETRADAWTLEHLVDRLDGAARKHMEGFRWASVLEGLDAALRGVQPQTTIVVPLLAADQDVLLNDRDAKRAVDAAVRETFPFWADQQEIMGATQVAVAGGELEFVAPSPHVAQRAAGAYLRARRRKANPSATLRRTPVWAWMSAAIALLSFGLSWAPLTWPLLLTLMALSAFAAVGAVAFAPRLSAKRSVTAWGLAPVMTLLGFACAYGAIGMLDESAIALDGSPLGHLREPLMLSLSLLTTGGLLDLQLHQWVRSIAYLEMLLVASLAGGAAIVAVRRVSNRVDAIVDDLRGDRDSPEG